MIKTLGNQNICLFRFARTVAAVLTYQHSTLMRKSLPSEFRRPVNRAKIKMKAKKFETS